MADHSDTEDDRTWSLRVAGIAVATIAVARPAIVVLTPEQVERCTEIVAEEIFIRFALGNRSRSKAHPVKIPPPIRMQQKNHRVDDP